VYKEKNTRVIFTAAAAAAVAAAFLVHWPSITATIALVH
jgi:hypothetical protein